MKEWVTINGLKPNPIGKLQGVYELTKTYNKSTRNLYGGQITKKPDHQIHQQTREQNSTTDQMMWPKHSTQAWQRTKQGEERGH